MSVHPFPVRDSGDEPPEGEQKRGKSSIAFPYGDQDDAVSVVEAIYRNSGQQCTIDQLAAWLEHDSVLSGAFRTKLSTARIFGLITTGDDQVRLTDLGFRIVDPQTQADARAEAFLAVPLYSAMFERYRGKLLPADVAIEREMENLGVAPKQRQRARQTFQRSAEQAGFFASGRDRLVRPGTRPTGEPARPPAAEPRPLETRSSASSSSGGGASLPPLAATHPLISGLFQTLPAAGSVWPPENRSLWLQAAENIFKLIYREGDE